MDKILTGNRIAMLRKRKKLTQTKLCIEMKQMHEEVGKITAINISSYESGSRMPSVEKLIAFADFFGVSTDYLLGLSDSYTDTSGSERTVESANIMSAPDTLIKQAELSKYHEQPVFVVSPEMVIHNRWAILDYFNKRLVFSSEIYPLNERMKLYCQVPLSSAYAEYNLPKPLSFSQLWEHDLLWIEALSPDRQIKGLYSGWYRHNEDKSALINCSNGLALPYTGLGISFNAYHLYR